MKKQFLTLMLMLVGMTAWAQSEQSGSGWTDPSSPSFTSETIVWLAIDCGNYDMYYYTDGYVSSYYEPQIAASLMASCAMLLLSMLSIRKRKSIFMDCVSLVLLLMTARRLPSRFMMSAAVLSIL